MKKIQLFGCAVLSVLALASCSNDETVLSGNGANQTLGDSQVFQVAVTNEGGLGTRATDFYSETTPQSIDAVKLVIYNTTDNSVVYSKTYNSWNTDAVSSIVTGENARQVTFELKGDEKLVAGQTYKAYAIGYNTSESKYTYTPALTTLDEPGEGEFTFGGALTAKTSDVAEEIFAGAIEGAEADGFQVPGDGQGFTKTILLKRQVAGTFGYFKNIPAVDATGTKTATALRLVASGKNMEVIMDEFQKGNAVNGKTDATAADAAFFDGTDAYEVYSITLTDWFTNGDENEDGVLNDEDTWTAGIAKEGVSFKDGSVFAGKFLVPFAKSADNTMQLQLMAGNEIIKYWNVRLPQAQSDVTTVTGADEAQTEDGSNLYGFNVLRNHLYTLGSRGAGDDGGEGGEPDPDDDPSDLSKGQSLIIKVSAEWDAMSDMVLD